MAVEPAANVFLYDAKSLENDVVALELFDPKKHSARFVALVQDHPGAFQYVAFPLLDSVDDFWTKIYNPIATSDADLLWAIVDKTRPAGDSGTDNDNNNSMAGVLSLTDTRKELASTEMGAVVFPAFQKSHVASNAIGLALQWLLDPPSKGGLGLRRVVWQANAKNTASRRVAERMGFTLEGILRWHRTFAPNRDCQAGPGVSTAALAARNGTDPKDEAPGRHTAVFSIVWDEWDNEKRAVVEAQMARRK